MKSRDLDPRSLDVQACAKNGLALKGQWPLKALERLYSMQTTEGLDDAVQIDWQAQGELRLPRVGEGQVWLHVTASTHVALTCQRCLQTFETPLSTARSLRFVRGEKAAAELDLDSEEDVLELPAELDVQALIEDELLLALPLVPMHETCPAPLPYEAGEVQGEASAHPFAALAVLKRKGLLN